MISEKNSIVAKRALFLALLLLFIGLITYEPYKNIQRFDSLFGDIFYLYFFVINQTLGIVHEGGHGICYILPCPEFFAVLNGTIFQLAFPFGAGYYYLKRGNKFLWYVGLFFLGFSMRYTAWYISTSRSSGLHVGAKNSFLGVDGYHDFYYILDYLGILPYDTLISILVNIISTLLLLYSLVRILFSAFMSPKE